MRPVMKPVVRAPILTRTVGELKKYVTSGDLRIGDMLPSESELVRILGAGRSTVREALRVLQTRGMISVRQGKGRFVERIDDTASAETREWFAEQGFEIAECFQVRRALEPLAVRLCCAHASEAEIAAVDRARVRFENAAATADRTAMAQLDREFHNAIAMGSHNTLLVAVSGLVQEAFAEYRRTIFSVTGWPEDAVELHARISDAIRSRNAERAANEMVRHVGFNMEDISQLTGREVSPPASVDP